MSHDLDMNVGRESDGRVVPAKCPNKGGSCTPAEGMEGRRPTKENTGRRPRPRYKAGSTRQLDCTVCAEQQIGYLQPYPHLRFDVTSLR